jgi:hypothetical protein
MKAYHFLKGNMTSGNGSEPPWTVGETRGVKGELRLCSRGYHSSPTPAAALKYASGPILCLVEVSAPQAQDETKQVSRRRRLIAAVDVTTALHELACRIADDVLPLWERQYPQDMRPRLAIEARRRWLRHEVTDAELAWAAGTAAGAAGAAGAAWAAGTAAGAAWAAWAAWDAAWAAGAAAGAAWAAWAAAGAAGAAWDAAGAAWAARAAAGAAGAAWARYHGWINEALLALLVPKK